MVGSDNSPSTHRRSLEESLAMALNSAHVVAEYSAMRPSDKERDSPSTRQAWRRQRSSLCRDSALPDGDRFPMRFVHALRSIVRFSAYTRERKKRWRRLNYKNAREHSTANRKKNILKCVTSKQQQNGEKCLVIVSDEVRLISSNEGARVWREEILLCLKRKHKTYHWFWFRRINYCWIYMLLKWTGGFLVSEI